MTGIICITLSVFSFGLSNCLWKYPLKKTGFLQIIVLRSFFTAALFDMLLMATRSGLTPVQWQTDNVPGLVEIAKAIALCVFSYFGLYFYVKSLKAEKVGIAVPVSSISGLFGVMTAVLFLKEKLALSFYMAAVAFLCGIFLINGSPARAFKLSTGVWYNMLAAFFWGVSFALFVFPVKALGVILFSFILEATVCICSVILFRFEKSAWSFPVKQIDNYILLLALLGFGGVVFYNLSLLYLPVSQISLLSVLTPVVSVVAASILFREKLTAKQYIGVCLIVIGLAVLNID